MVMSMRYFSLMELEHKDISGTPGIRCRASALKYVMVLSNGPVPDAVLLLSPLGESVKCHDLNGMYSVVAVFLWGARRDLRHGKRNVILDQRRV